MRRVFGITITLFFIITFGVVGIFYVKSPQWKLEVSTLLKEAESATKNPDEWSSVFKKSKDLPRFYPFSTLREIFEKTNQIFVSIENIKEKIKTIETTPLKTSEIRSILTSFEKIDKNLYSIENKINNIPSGILPKEQQFKHANVLQKLKSIRTITQDTPILTKIFNRFSAEERRLLILLQNENEVRPTGGFVGSAIIVDFSEENISWHFSDIYALDRLVPIDKQLSAPDFFHGLSKTISMRDANFWPHFPTSAQTYLKFFGDTNKKVPDTVIAINLNLIKEILKVTGPIKLEKWGITLDQYNFDIGLNFLVESKISGRFATKRPVMDFAEKLFSSAKWKSNLFDPNKHPSFDTFWKQKISWLILKTKNCKTFSKNGI